jgi:Leucine-rich repeat (LRR) protein
MSVLYLGPFPQDILTGMAAPTSNTPWYRPTFRRELFALLAFEMFLLLAERCRWFGLVKDSGGRELETVTLFAGWAAVVAACLVGLLWLIVLGSRRRFQYGLRTLLLLTLLVSIGMSWIATAMQRAKRQREVARAIEKLGGRVWWDLASRHEASFLSEVVYVDLSGGQIQDEALQSLRELTHLARLNLNNSDITDSQLRHLKGLAQLRWLELEAPRVTDAAVKELQQALPNCQIDH